MKRVLFVDDDPRVLDGLRRIRDQGHHGKADEAGPCTPQEKGSRPLPGPVESQPPRAERQQKRGRRKKEE